MDCICKDDNPIFCAALRFRGDVNFNMDDRDQDSYSDAPPQTCKCVCHVDKFYIREHLAQQITARHFAHRRQSGRDRAMTKAGADSPLDDSALMF